MFTFLKYEFKKKGMDLSFGLSLTIKTDLAVFDITIILYGVLVLVFPFHGLILVRVLWIYIELCNN